MKKALKILMLALLVVPCALVFTACNKTIGKPEVSRYVFDAYKKLVSTENYETWQDVKMTQHQEATSVDETIFNVQTANGTDEQKKEGTTKVVGDLTVERKGQKEDTIIVATSKTVTTSTTYQLNAEGNGLDCYVTTKTETSTLYLGRIGAKDTGKYYAAFVTATEGTQTKNGVEDKDYADAVNVSETKTKYEFGDVDEYEETVTSISNDLISTNLAVPSFVTGLMEEGYEFKATQNGKNVTIKLSQENEFNYAGLTTTNYTLKMNDYNLASLTFNMDNENYSEYDLTTSKESLQGNFDVAYSSNAKMLSESDLNGYNPEETMDFDAIVDTLTSGLGF